MHTHGDSTTNAPSFRVEYPRSKRKPALAVTPFNLLVFENRGLWASKLSHSGLALCLIIGLAFYFKRHVDLQ
jgi:hypothetical protein